MPKKLKSCSRCSELAAERDRLLTYRELYQKSEEQKEKLRDSLERAWKLIDQLTETNSKKPKEIKGNA